ncbi:MAG TPA: ABC transporter permease [Streptosporangiaceae bacterium]|nr:ABC transporter permease [Streptosporangiaceae bacterium]HEX5290295.1 ABC transporter permease [Streptosporangiaceae bacterium]
MPTSARWRGPVWLAVRLVLSLLAISVLVFLLTVAVPGDPARAALGKAATAAQLKAFDMAHGLDAPLYEQFGRFLLNLVQGRLGTSYASGQAVAAVIGARFERTFFLVLIAWLIAALVSIPVGIWSGRRAGSLADSAVSGTTLGLAALPEFVIGLLLVFIVGVRLGWLPVNSTAAGYATTPWGDFSSYVLPAIAISFTIIPYITRLARANAREVDSEPYIRAAILRGVHGPRLSILHVLPNAAPPVLSALALQFAGSIGGVVVTETVFGFPGIGQLLVQAVGSRDLPVVQAITIIIGAVYVLVNTLADAGVVALTPRLRPTQQLAAT